MKPRVDIGPRPDAIPRCEPIWDCIPRPDAIPRPLPSLDLWEAIAREETRASESEKDSAEEPPLEDERRFLWRRLSPPELL